MQQSPMLIELKSRMMAFQYPKKPVPFSPEMPRKFFTWEDMIVVAAPAVNPITTLSEMKLTTHPT